MAFNGSGTFNRVHSWATDKAAATKITASRMDAEDDGFATGLSTCIAKDGQTTITANLPMNSKKLTGLAAGTTAGDSVRYEQAVTAVAITGGTITGLTSLGVSGTATLTDTDAGAANGPFLILDRNSATPAASDEIGQISFNGRNSAAATKTYAFIEGTIGDATDTSEDSSIRLGTFLAGTSNARMTIAGGMYMKDAAGTDQGDGSINADAVYDDGVLLCAPIEEAQRGGYDAAEWARFAPHDGLATHEAMKAKGFDPQSHVSFATEVLSHGGIPGYWNKDEWTTRLAQTKKDHKGNDIIARVSLAERHERTLLALDYLSLAVVSLSSDLALQKDLTSDLLRRVEALEGK
jgi:hypothetical protein